VPNLDKIAAVEVGCGIFDGDGQKALVFRGGFYVPRGSGLLPLGSGTSSITLTTVMAFENGLA